jgi:hypothetical protein
MLWQEDVTFPRHYRPLPPGYRIIQHDSGHYQWVRDGTTNRNGGPVEGFICWDRWWVRRCAFGHAAEGGGNG